MVSLIMSLFLSQPTFAKVDQIDPTMFKIVEIQCLTTIDRKKINEIADYLKVWEMPKADKEIMLSLIVDSLTLQCLQDKLKQ